MFVLDGFVIIFDILGVYVLILMYLFSDIVAAHLLHLESVRDVGEFGCLLQSLHKITDRVIITDSGF